MTASTEVNNNVSRIKEVMGDTYEDRLIIQALSIHQNNFERALNYLLEGNQFSPESDPPTVKLRKSLEKAFTHNSQGPEHPQTQNLSQIGWGEAQWAKPPSNPSMQTGRSSNVENLQKAPQSATGGLNTEIPSNPEPDAREPEVLPNSPPKGPYQPVTVTGQTTPTEDTRLMEFSFHEPPKRNAVDSNNRSPPFYQQLPAVDSTSPDLLAADDSARYEAELHAAIKASLASEFDHPSSSPAPVLSGPRPLKDLSTEDEQMSKALEESLAMSGSRTAEINGKYLDPPAHQRQRIPGNPVALRVQNPHLVFLPCILSAMYAAKPFRDRVLAFKPKLSPEFEPLIEHDVGGMWNGKSSWRSGENWPEKPRAVEIVLAVQRLFAMMTQTKRSYLDVNELSLLLGYEEGETISWTLNEPNKGCNKTYGVIAEAWRELAWETFKVPSLQSDNKELAAMYEDERRLFYWRGHRLPLPLPQDELDQSLPPNSADNSTASLTLSAMGSNLNDIYSCIDAQVWVPESSAAHFLDGTSHVFGFEIDRKGNSSQYTWSSSGSSHNLGESKKPFALEAEFWIDRYLLQRRHKIVELREEISRIEGEADVSLARRDQLSKAGSKDLVNTLKAAVEYLSESTQFPSITSAERENRRQEMLPKFQEALSKLEAELSSLDQKAKTALSAAKSVFDIPKMKEFGPYDLCSAIVFDGFPGRDHMWSYIKSDDGHWFKSNEQNMIEVTLETVLSDSAGLHMNSGHVFAIYVRRPPPDNSVVDSTAIELPPPLKEAIAKDNALFAAEVLESNTLPPTNYSTVDREVVMTSDSPRSDVAEAGGGIELNSPLRLSGGAASKQGCNSDEEDEFLEIEDDEYSDLVELGFLKKIKRRLDVTTMTGKVGGQPIWLDPGRPLDAQSVTCCSCAKPMSFLLQMNAPEDSNSDAYYRAIYLFICRKMSCIRLNAPGSLKAFRIQFPNDTQFDQASAIELPLGPPFKEWELRSDEEPEEVEDSSASDYLSSLPSFGMKSTNDQDARVKETKAPVDEAFLKFQSRISRAPRQVLRYLRISNPPVKPLLASDQSKMGEAVSNCEICGSERNAEFQIISTILASLGEDLDHSSEDGLDFGTILIYTCPKSCSTKTNSNNNKADNFEDDRWVKEVCLLQTFSNDGVFFK